MVSILIHFLNFFCLCSHSLSWLFFIPLQSEVEESLKRIQGHKGVVGIVIVNQEGRETQLFWSILIAYQNTRSTLSLKAYSGRLLSFLSAYFVRWFVNTAGIPIRTTMDNSTTVQYAGLIHQLTAKARSTVRDIDPQVSFINRKKLTFAPRNDKGIYLKKYWSYFCDKLINKWYHKPYQSTPENKIVWMLATYNFTYLYRLSLQRLNQFIRHKNSSMWKYYWKMIHSFLGGS